MDRWTKRLTTAKAVLNHMLTHEGECRDISCGGMAKSNVFVNTYSCPLHTVIPCHNLDRAKRMETIKTKLRELKEMQRKLKWIENLK